MLPLLRIANSSVRGILHWLKVKRLRIRETKIPTSLASHQEVKVKNLMGLSCMHYANFPIARHKLRYLVLLVALSYNENVAFNLTRSRLAWTVREVGVLSYLVKACNAQLFL